MSNRVPERVFISYSRQDIDWLKRLKLQLAPLEDENIVDLWYDSGELEPGDVFRESINTAIESSSAAVLLVSADFQASEFIKNNELPKLRYHADRKELRLFWIPVGHCILTDQLGDAYHTVGNPSKPLEACTKGEVNEVLADLTRSLKNHVLAQRKTLERLEKEREEALKEQKAKEEKQRREKEAIAAREERRRNLAIAKKEKADKKREEALLRVEQRRANLEKKEAARVSQKNNTPKKVATSRPARSPFSKILKLIGLCVLIGGVMTGANVMRVRSSSSPPPEPVRKTPTLPDSKDREIELAVPNVKIRTKESAAPEVKEDLGPSFANSLGIRLVRIPQGSFLMGSAKTESFRGTDEDQHKVRLDKSFYLAETELSQGQWLTLMEENPSVFRGDNLPVESVSWERTYVFIDLLNQKETASGLLPEGWRYDLPTEAQWEYACRAGTTTPFYFGETLNSEQANFDGDFPFGETETGPDRKTTLPVQQFTPNQWGLYQVHGNVWEWCRDWYGEYSLDEITANPVGPKTGRGRVYRGGGWNNNGRNCRSAARNFTPSREDSSIGFRIGLFRK
ncbi:MAG: SUMF1/EgtB/PvdO family nonheme iron enzyme [Verrucomicrobiales bacterium]|nr:SUMF1/EgtB/PvdO family nonheme iron enzyme [Verrucomicrobiales bacterium]